MRDPANIGLGGCTSLHEFSHWPCAHTQSGKEGYWVHWGVANPKANVMGGGGRQGQQPARGASRFAPNVTMEMVDGPWVGPLKTHYIGGQDLNWRIKAQMRTTNAEKNYEVGSYNIGKVEREKCEGDHEKTFFL